MALRVVVPVTADPADRDIILAGLKAYNESQVGPGGHEAVSALIQDETGATVGGLWGRSAFGWLFIELVFVPESLRGRGLGRELMRAAEHAARARGCHGVWLDTYEFQARGFYEKQGYRLFGELDDYPTGHKRFFLSKRL